ncbi:MAG TPA: SPOR domain-containing protein [Sedimenticola sp.]|nr:SPOR domain-containing protein [Sedimenticola sp.]
MPRDYKSRANSPRRKPKRQVPGWVWFLSGLLVGLFFSGLAWLKLLPSEERLVVPPPQAKVSAPPVGKGRPEKKEPAAPRPRFDFYTILPEMEVVVPEPEPEAPPPRVKRGKIKKEGPVASGGRYMLQMGSFRRYSDADRLKASLALVGIRADIQKVRVSGSGTFHRVRSGPYTEAKVNQLRRKLKQNGIDSLVIKLKG